MSVIEMRNAIILGVLAVAACGDNGGVAMPDAGVDASADAPAAALPDLRFKWVRAFPGYRLGDGIGLAADNIEISSTGGVYAPLTLDGTFLNEFTSSVPVQPFVSTAMHLPIADLADRLHELLPNAVVTSLNFFEAGFSLTATASVAPNTALGSIVAFVSRDELASFAVRQAARHEVITALGLNGASVETIGYLVIGDPATYETMVLEADAATLGAQAEALGAAGYVITAMGSVGPGAFALVGTRVAGAVTPRSVMMVSGQTLADALGRGYAIVGAVLDGTTQVSIVEN